jgi:hypothetical protein
MTTRRNLEAAIADYFLLGPEADVRVMFRVIRGFVKSRGLLADKKPAAKPRVKRQRSNGPLVTTIHAQE